MSNPIIVTKEGYQLGWVVAYTTRDSLGLERIQHGRIWRSYDEALAATADLKPDTTAEVVMVRTHFEGRHELAPVPYTMGELARMGLDRALAVIAAAEVERVAA